MAKRRLDLVLVIDIEATCWDGPAPEGQESEIIEVGLCTLDVATGERVEKRSILVKPQHSTVSAFCTQLTSLTQEQVDSGITFPEACEILRAEYLSPERVWASYGDYDRQMFEKQCHDSNIGYPFSSRHVNIKTWYALVHALPREWGLAAVITNSNREFEGTHHRGDDDAWNTAAILGDLLKRGRGGHEPGDEIGEEV